MQANNRHLTRFLYATEGVGIVFVGIFLAAYLSGLPTTAVLHSDPTVRLALTIVGAAFLVLVLATVILAAVYRKR